MKNEKEYFEKIDDDLAGYFDTEMKCFQIRIDGYRGYFNFIKRKMIWEHDNKFIHMFDHVIKYYRLEADEENYFSIKINDKCNMIIPKEIILNKEELDKFINYTNRIYTYYFGNR